MASFAPVIASAVLTVALLGAVLRVEAAWKRPDRQMRRRDRADARRYGDQGPRARGRRLAREAAGKPGRQPA